MRITTWNVNGIRARKERLINWIERNKPDVLCLQETRCEDQVFPYDDLHKLYKHICHTNQKKANGVAILSRHAMADIDINPVGEDQHRSIAATIKNYRIINLYVPQGQNLESEKYPYKLNWWENFVNWYDEQGKEYGYEQTVVVGDYNIVPTASDAWSAKAWHSGIVSCTPPERKMFFDFIKKHHLIDAVRSITDKPSFTWYGYREWKWKNLHYGVRIDHVLHTPDLKARSFNIDTVERMQAQGASDHLPLTVEF